MATRFDSELVACKQILTVTPQEARDLITALTRMLADPEADHRFILRTTEQSGSTPLDVEFTVSEWG